jgi:PAS domain S-box-containing protein
VRLLTELAEDLAFGITSLRRRAAHTRAEEALQESEQRFRALMTASSEVMYCMSPDWSEMRQLQSEGFLANTERPNRSWLQEYILPDDQPYVTSVINESIRTKSIFALEHRVRRADGRIGWTFSRAVPILDSNGEIVEWFGAASDITERKQAEETLRKANDELEQRVIERTAELQASSLYARSLIETNLDPLVTISTDGKIMDVNNATEEATGFTRQQLIGSDFSDYFAEPERARAGYKKVFRKGFVRDYPLELKHRDGHITPVLYNASVYRDEAGQIKGVFAAARDITTLKKMEEEMRAAHSKLRAMTSEIIKTEERERQRIATVLHDSIAQTLGAAKMRLELLGEYVSPNGRETQRETLDLISESIRQTRSTMAELSPPILNELGFVPALEWLSEQIENQHGLRVDFRGNGELQPLNHDLEVLLFQGTKELLTNVAKHAKAKKAVVTVSENKGRVQIEVKDNGIGFEKEQSDSKDDLTGGFGLFNIRERLNHFGGQLTIRSGHKGSHVIMTVPIR